MTMTGDKSTKNDATLNSSSQITAELCEHPLSLSEHDVNTKIVSIKGN